MKRIWIALALILGIVLLPLGGYELFLLTQSGLAPARAGYVQLVTGSAGEQVKTSYRGSRRADYQNLEQLPDFVPDFLVALEDQNFYSHRGFDLGRTLKSAFDDIISSKVVAGGSTITQQLARLLYLNNKKSLGRKISELTLAKRLERGLSKRQILELYLNEVYFGDDIYGIGAASQYYFGKEAGELERAEAILLLSLLPSPNAYSPKADLERSKAVYRQAVKNLYYRGAIEAGEYYELTEDYPVVRFESADRDYELYYYQAVQQRLEKAGVETRTRELEVNSWLDRPLQNTIGALIEGLDKDPTTEVAVVVMEPATGAVRALIGGSRRDSFNRAVDAYRSIGSTVKPIIYTIALENGFTPLSSFVSKPTTFYLEDGVVYAPANSNDIYADRAINMVEAIATSDNIYATKLNLVLGSRSLSERLANIGLEVEPQITNSLGTLAMSPLQLTAIYNALAAGGIYREPQFFRQVQAGGQTVLSSSGKSVRLFKEKESRQMSYLLRAPTDKALRSYATPTMLYHPTTHRFAVKTGSTESSSFVVGYNPQYTIGVYAGTDDNAPLQDVSLAKSLFQQVADLAMSGKADYFYPATDLQAFSLFNRESGLESFTYYR